MALGAAAGVPPCHLSAPFSLSLHTSARASVTYTGATAADTKTHIANLDRLLLKSLPATELPIHNNGGFSGAGEEEKIPTKPFRLASLFPRPKKMTAGDEILSPGSLKRLQLLLSDSSRHSPRNSIADRWRELHGAKAWAGLLDPLDENLRRELLRYGDFVQTAYHAFHSLPSPAAASPSSLHRQLLLPDRSYRATKSLFATSSVDVPGWAQPAAPRWLAQRSSWIGYVAVCDDDREVRRMGRRDIAIVLRGTATCLEWAENFRAGLVPVDTDADGGQEELPKVARGFLSLYRTAGERVTSLATAVVEEVRRLMEVYEGEELSITVAGHSLGAALALLVGDELSVACGPATPPITVVSFGGPKAGNGAFAERVRRRRVNVLRVVSEGDVVTMVPGLPHVSDRYEHMGEELRVDARDSPYIKPDAGPACRHDLEAYLHLVDGFNGAGFGFRSDAKRSLVRLLELQRPNIKRVYLSRARAVRPNPVIVRMQIQSAGPACLPSPSN